MSIGRQAGVLAALAILATGTARADEQAKQEQPVRGYPTAGVGAGGAVGLGRLTSAARGETGSLRLGLRGAFFQGADFPVEGSHRQLQGELSAGYTLTPAVELFGAYRNSSHSNALAVPALVQAQGDVLLGVKAGLDLGGTALSADVRLDLRNGLGQDMFAFDGSTVVPRLLATRPLTLAGRRVVLHGNAGAALGASTSALEMDAAQLFGTGFSAYHRLLFGVGAQVELGSVIPYASFDLDQPLGIDAAELAERATSAFSVASKRLTLGARLRAGSAGALDLAVELGTGDGAHGFARTSPYLLTAAYSFAFDEGLYAPPAPPQAPPAPTTGQIGGVVSDLSGTPLAGAIVQVAGTGTPVATGIDGRFLTLDLTPGPVTLEVQRPGYKPTTFEARVAAGRAAPATILLEAEPPPAPPPPPPPAPPTTGFLAGRVESTGPRLQAIVRISGPEGVETRVNDDGSFSLRVPPGLYDVTVIPEAHFARTAQAAVVADQVSVVLARTVPRPGTPAFSLADGVIVPVKPLVLDDKRLVPEAAAASLLAELADLLVRDPTRRLLVAVHADPAKKGKSDDRKVWTEARAQALRQALVAAGAPPARVEAQGFGADQPLLPATAKDQAKNRRIELKLVPVAVEPPPLPPKLPEPALDVPEPAVVLPEPAVVVPEPAVVLPAPAVVLPEPALPLPELPELELSELPPE